MKRPKVKTVNLKVRITEREKENLERFAQRSFITMSDVVRISVAKFTKYEHTVANPKVG